MAIVMGWISIGRRSPRSGSIPTPARSRGVGSCRRTARACASSWRGSVAGSSRWRWRRRRAGGSWSRSSAGSARACTWRSRRRRARCAGTSSAPKNDRADSRHLRELLMTGRLPECWIAPDHLLDLRARVRLRHTLVDERGEWQQRMQAVLYHHGLPKRADLLTRENRAWVEQLALPDGGTRATHGRARDDRRARGSHRTAR